MTATVTSTGSGPLYRAILADMNTTGRHLAVAAELARVPMLAQVTGERLRHLAAAHPVRCFTAGSVLLRQGAPATHLLIMLDGQASAVVDHPAGDRTRYPLLAGPCVIDKAAVLAAGTYPATWVATTQGRVLTLSAAAFWALLRQQPPVREHVLRYLARQVGQSRDALAARAVGTPVSRLARWLLTASVSGATPAVCLPAGQQGLAEELGLSRVTVNRALQQLVRAGLISVRPRAVVILDPARLASATDRQPGRAASGSPGAGVTSRGSWPGDRLPAAGPRSGNRSSGGRGRGPAG
jgi:CRP/FNR family transcriptional regulator, cyclic AMP receptor protein